MRLVLASQSPSRLRLLRMAGLEPEVVVSDVDEEALVEAERPTTPQEYVQLLATAKARSVARKVVGPIETTGSAEGGRLDRLDSLDQQECLVLGCDSTFVLDGVIYNKPYTAEVARERWRGMHGRTGSLHTGHTLIDLATGAEARAVTTTELDFAEVTDAEIDWYVRSGEPLEVAGAFTLDGLASAFITRIVGDPHSVVGLSIAALRTLVRDLGHDWTRLVA